MTGEPDCRDADRDGRPGAEFLWQGSATPGETPDMLLHIVGSRVRPLLRGGGAVPQPECGQHQARECYQRADYLKGVAV